MHDAMKAYHESWERELDRQFLKNDRYRKRAYICSPLSGSTAEEELSNIGVLGHTCFMPHHAGIPGTRPPRLSTHAPV